MFLFAFLQFKIKPMDNMDNPMDNFYQIYLNEANF